MYMNVIDLSKSVSFVLEDIDIGGQIQYLTCTGPLLFLNLCEFYLFDDLFWALLHLTSYCNQIKYILIFKKFSNISKKFQKFKISKGPVHVRY